jgi:mRNA interferase MazF
MKFEAGDLVLVPFPFTNLQSRKQRPALVLSPGAFNAGPDLIVCAMTSNLQNSAHSILIEQRDLRDGALAATSRIKVSKLVTLDKSLVRKRIGSVKPGILRSVAKELRGLLPSD